MSKIQMEDTVMEIIAKMSDGNPGAINTMMIIMQEHDKIDPQAFLGGMGAIMMLDTYEIYGADIYVLFNDKCNKDVRKMLMLMRATQLGFFSMGKLKELAADHSRQNNLTEEEWKELDDKVCDQLAEFKRAS